MIVAIWIICIIFALLQLIAVVLLIKGRGERLLVVEEKQHLYHLERVRILTIILSISAIAFCIVFPLMITIDNRDGVLWATGTIVAIAVIIALLIQTWAKKK
jgi:hypothetical protein